MQDTKIALCHHILATGKRCGSPSLRGEEFCYFHHPTRRPQRRARVRSTAFVLPPILDRQDLQISVSEIMMRLADNRLDTKRAGLILHCIQMASANLRS